MEIAMSEDFLDVQDDDYAVAFFYEDGHIFINTWVLIPEEFRDPEDVHDDGTSWWTAQLFNGVIGVE